MPAAEVLAPAASAQVHFPEAPALEQAAALRDSRSTLAALIFQKAGGKAAASVTFSRASSEEAVRPERACVASRSTAAISNIRSTSGFGTRSAAPCSA